MSLFLLFFPHQQHVLMCHRAPTSGGQYHWVSEFAPKRLQKFLSYLVGWVTVFGSLTACAATAYISGTQVQALVILNYPDYDPKMWHSSLLTSAVAAFSVFFNTVLARNLPFIEGVMFVLHIFTFLGIIVALLVLSPRTDAMTVFTQFNDGGGWGDLGVSSLVGASASVLSLMGGDASVHMAEELQDAGRNVPRSMLWSLSIGSGMSWIMMIVYCLCLGDLTDALSTPTGYPFIQVFYNSTQSITAATIMASAVIFMWMFSGMSGVAVTSRMLYAFARDNGLPFSSWFSRVTPVWSIPLNAIVTTFIFTSLVSFIAIGSATALSSFTSLCSSSVLSGYACSISCMIWRRWTNSPLLPSSFSLGQWGLLINISSVLFLLFIIVLGFFPPTPTNVLDCMNWSVIGYAGSIAFCIVYYFLYGRYQYTSPVEHTRKLE